MALIATLGLSASLSAVAIAADSQVIPIAQGPGWTPERRNAFYVGDQGSEMIELAWLKALKTADGRPFLEDGLKRYGYLPNPASPFGLPVGFTVTVKSGGKIAGMTCAACHTRQISVADREYRIDGGPAIVDFETFLHDLDGAVGRVLADQTAFREFAAAVGTRPDQLVEFRSKVGLWYLRLHTLIARALPVRDLWGVGRLDAVSMIYNRVTGLDIGPAPSFIIADNIKRADAPVRYPFLWDSPRQDRTQWAGFAANGSQLHGLTRNLGEVYGVFAAFRPRNGLASTDFRNNSANIDGLIALERLVMRIGPPTWPWGTNPALVSEGEAVYSQNCASCHNENPGLARIGATHTWKTPNQDVGTDSRQYAVLNRDAATGILAGRGLWPVFPLIKRDRDSAFAILRTSVGGSLIQEPKAFLLFLDGATATPLRFRQLKGEIKDFYDVPGPGLTEFPYESRMMHGIWAAAPYLHNGSVPTLADLLKPASERPAEFDVGRFYDIANVGLASRQSGVFSHRVTTGCEQRNSGNSRCGHEFGTGLSPAKKLALLEYLKTL